MQATPNYTIEPLRSSELADYKRLIDECFGTSNPLSDYRNYSGNNEYIIWCIKDGDRIVGSATQYTIRLFTFSFQPCLMLFNVAVHQTYRQQGAAKALLSFIIGKAKQDGYRSISLTCLISAHEAHKLYESVGFTRTSSLKYAMDL